MIFKLFSLNDGIVKYEDVQAIRVKNETSNLLILKDYVPIIGDIDGSLEIITKETVTLNDIKGYYICFDNIFNLILEEL